MIQVDQLWKSFAGVTAVKGVSFQANKGEITGVLGPNGAGKSTTLRMLYTAVKPDQGDALINGCSVVKDPLAVRAQIGVLTHGAGIYERLTAEENIRYFGRLHGMSKAALNQRIDELADMMEMGAFLHRRAKGFSQGQKTKVALARALVHRPEYLLLDEPTNGLDVMATRSLRQMIIQLREAGHCVLFCSHVMQEVAALCDRIVVIAGGQIIANGTPTELQETADADNLEDAFVHLIGSDEGLV